MTGCSKHTTFEGVVSPLYGWRLCFIKWEYITLKLSNRLWQVEHLYSTGCTFRSLALTLPHLATVLPLLCCAPTLMVFNLW
ncbi:hypothetical protein ACB092_05G168400 [Castanea dentata]